jgi:hypothetical protein
MKAAKKFSAYLRVIMVPGTQPWIRYACSALHVEKIDA